MNRRSNYHIARVSNNSLARKGQTMSSKDNGQTWETPEGFRKGAEIIMADVSFSMNSPVAGMGSTKRIDAVNQAISSYGAEVQTISFSDTAELHVGPVNLVCKSTTNMSSAFVLAKQYEPNYLLVLSDGAVNDPDDTLRLARELAEIAIIDTLYIGPDDPAAEQFMRDLAKVGHGRARRYDMTKPQVFQLESVIKGLLPPPDSQAIKL